MKFKCNPLTCECCGYRIPQRVILAIMLHLALLNCYAIRIALNVAIVEMVERPMKKNRSEQACPEHEPIDSKRKGAKFPWPQTAKAEVLYSFFVGYFLTCLPGGWLADKFGGRYVLGWCVLFSAITNVVFPYFTENRGHEAAIVLRGLLGTAQGSTLPTIASFVSTWIPAKERTVLGGISYGGSNLGTVVSSTLTGIIIDHFNGWPAAFYFWSAASMVYLILHMALVFSFPSTHPFIAKEELQYLTDNIVTKRRNLTTPWKAILTNIPYWSNIAGQFGHNYIFFLMVTWLPTYMKDILQYDIAENGVFSAMPFLALWLSSLVLSFSGDYLINGLNCMTSHTFNVVFGTSSNIASSVFVLGAVYAGCNRQLCITLYISGMVVKAFYYMTFPVNINELSKNYGGTMFGICNGISGLSGLLGCLILGAITRNNKISEWKIAFWITLGIELATSIIYILGSSSERQAFDFDQDTEQYPE